MIGEEGAPANIGQGDLTRRQRALSRFGEQRKRVAEAQRKTGVPQATAGDMTIKALGLCNGLEPVLGFPDCLGSAEHQDAALAQRKVEQRDDLRLRLGIEINQEIAAGDEVDPRKGRVRKDILDGEYDIAAQRRRNPVAGFVFHEEASEPFR